MRERYNPSCFSAQPILQNSMHPRAGFKELDRTGIVSLTRGIFDSLNWKEFGIFWVPPPGRRAQTQLRATPSAAFERSFENLLGGSGPLWFILPYVLLIV